MWKLNEDIFPFFPVTVFSHCSVDSTSLRSLSVFIAMSLKPRTVPGTWKLVNKCLLEEIKKKSWVTLTKFICWIFTPNIIIFYSPPWFDGSTLGRSEHLLSRPKERERTITKTWRVPYICCRLAVLNYLVKECKKMPLTVIFCNSIKVLAVVQPVVLPQWYNQ